MSAVGQEHVDGAIVVGGNLGVRELLCLVFYYFAVFQCIGAIFLYQ